MTDSQYFAQAYLITVAYPKQFRKGFADWLYENLDIQRRLEAEALAVVNLGFRHYSAHTIIEYLRHHTNLTDKTGRFKIDEKWSSSMARLFAHMHPQHKDLFSFRVRKHAVVGALEM